MDKDVKFAFVGGGNMAANLIGALVSGGCSPKNFRVADPDPSQRNRLRQRFGVEITEDNAAAATGADVVILAVKPQVAAAALQDMAPAPDAPLYLSVIAGIREAALRRWLDTDGSIVRAMPNTPALLGCGITGLYCAPSVPGAMRELAEGIMRSSGAVAWVDDEALLDPVTALSGSGPAYFFLLMEVMTRTGIDMGLDPEAARLLTQETALGAARMALESESGVAELRERVTSPGGTTAAAMEVLKSRGVPEAIADAIRAAAERASELATEYGNNRGS
jgi:pyrroline-5-carboxylate reductase